MTRTDTPDAPENTTPPERFTLHETEATHWLGHAVAAHMALNYDVPPPADLGPEPDIELPEMIGSDWSPRDPDELSEVFELVSAAVEGGIISMPPGADLDFEPLRNGAGDEYQFKVHVGRFRLTLTSRPDEVRKLGEPGATGVAAALAVLREAVASANGVLDALDEYAAEASCTHGVPTPDGIHPPAACPYRARD